MDRISSTGTILDSNGHRIRVAQNISTGTNGTELDAGYDNNLQEEIVGGLIEYTGQSPSTSDLRQVQKGLQLLSPQPVRVAVPGPFSLTVPPGMTRLFVAGLWGPGGDGGNSSGNPALGGGAGSGAFCSGVLTGLSPGTVLDGIIGAPGTDSVITGWMSAGSGANGSDGVSASGAAGLGGTAQNLNSAHIGVPLFIDGVTGRSGWQYLNTTTDTWTYSGQGAAAPFGGGTSHTGVQSSTHSAGPVNGSAGNFPGGGGEGGQQGGTGGPGGSGFLDGGWLP